MSLSALKERLRYIQNLKNVGRLLDWDMQTYMPPGGAAARADQLATVQKVAHEMLIDDETARLLEAAAKELDGSSYDSDDASLVRVAKRDYEEAVKLPAAFVEEYERTVGLAHEVWVKARAESNFAHFQPMLEKIVGLVRQRAEYLGYQAHPYDALLNEYEPGMTTAEVRKLFDELRVGLVPLVKAISERQSAVSDEVLAREYPIEKQREFSMKVIEKFGFDFQRGRLDVAVHPFCTHFSRDDVRLTTRYDAHWLSDALFGTLHESGHGMYEQGSPAHLDLSILATGTSLGIHESQSRLWENVIGRSRAFWEFFYPQLQAIFTGTLDDVPLETFYKVINASKPSFIRVEADEVTYNLHIMVRFDIETALVAGELEVKDIPHVWNAKMQDYLGITPPTDALGCLQDVHWSAGYIGYFPTYALGNLLAVQFYEKALEQHPSLPDEIRRGEFGTLLNWLRENIHVHGRKYLPKELVQRVTGTSIQTTPFLRYLNKKYSEIYGL